MGQDNKPFFNKVSSVKNIDINRNFVFGIIFNEKLSADEKMLELGDALAYSHSQTLEENVARLTELDQFVDYSQDTRADAARQTAVYGDKLYAHDINRGYERVFSILSTGLALAKRSKPDATYALLLAVENKKVARIIDGIEAQAHIIRQMLDPLTDERKRQELFATYIRGENNPETLSPLPSPPPENKGLKR